MGICLKFDCVEAFQLEDIFSLSPAVHFNKQVSVFVTFLGVALDAIKKGENLARQTTKDSMRMNLGKSAASFSKSDWDKFLCFFFFFFFKDIMSDVYFLLFLCSTTYYGIQLVLGIYQGGNPFALVEMGIHDQYTWAGSRFSISWQFQLFSKRYCLPCNVAVVKFLFSQHNSPSATTV